MKTVILILSVVLLSCSKEKCDVAMPCNGFEYSCETSQCQCVFPFDGESCGTYIPEKHEGTYLGALRETWDKSGSVNWAASATIKTSPSGDYVLEQKVQWINETTFDVYSDSDDLIGSGSVIDEKLTCTYEYTSVKDGDFVVIQVYFNGIKA